MSDFSQGVEGLLGRFIVVVLREIFEARRSLKLTAEREFKENSNTQENKKKSIITHPLLTKRCGFNRGARLATSSGDGTVKIWDFSKAECVLTFTDHTHAVWGCSWHSCGDFLASCSMDNTCKVWDVNR